jgi:hypothetical protein
MIQRSLDPKHNHYGQSWVQSTNKNINLGNISISEKFPSSISGKCFYTWGGRHDVMACKPQPLPFTLPTLLENKTSRLVDIQTYIHTYIQTDKPNHKAGLLPAKNILGLKVSLLIWVQMSLHVREHVGKKSIYAFGNGPKIRPTMDF